MELQEITDLRARFVDITKQARVTGPDLDVLNQIKERLTAIVEDEDYNDEFRMQASEVVAEITDYKVGLVISMGPMEIEKARQETIARLSERIDRREHRDDLNKGRNTSKLFT